ncbi:sulfite exporter TauE/SafE family protein [uncultured Pseudonocardia sp.]|uniref:sulfite exporter TauE/SafE family protein n=1 Tax=uncultured Pseudonocardia sp. TaxID=211455 RepID=UPI00261273EC|nr:sulfite exporter TauE/SafE family protein [uncultured Pseudonocardia sp.]
MILAGVFGLIIGAALGLLGAGGSILAVPALIYGVGQPVPAALFGSLLVVAISAAGGLVVRLRTATIRWPVALVFAAAGVPTAFAGTALGKLLPTQWLLLAFTVLMAVVAVLMLRGNPDEGGGVCRTGGGGINWRSCLPKALAAGAGVGLLTGLFGVGGGFIIVPALTLLLGLTAAEAIATSLAIVTLTSLSGLAAHAAAAAASVDYGVIGVFAAAALLASLLAGRLANRLPAAALRRGFAFVILAVAAGVAAAALFAPAALHTS